jgi:acetyltransferase-like isoleucine patch superfamily enzyme
MKNNSLLHRLKYGFRVWYKTYVEALDRSKFGYITDDVTLIPPLTIPNPKNVFLYGDNGLRDAKIFTINARFIMKPHSGSAEGLRVSTGNHAMVLGHFYRSIKEKDKPKGLDKDVVVESDVWIGRNVTLLAGVTIGRGCTIGAGAVVSKDMPPYTVCVGVPARPVKFKWTKQQILQHEEMLYLENERFTPTKLDEIAEQTERVYGIEMKEV